MKADTDIIDQLCRLADLSSKINSRIALTIPEAGQALGVTDNVIKGMIDRGELRCRRVGKQRLVSVESLRQLFR